MPSSMTAAPGVSQEVAFSVCETTWVATSEARGVVGAALQRHGAQQEQARDEGV